MVGRTDQHGINVFTIEHLSVVLVRRRRGAERSLRCVQDIRIYVAKGDQVAIRLRMACQDGTLIAEADYCEVRAIVFRFR